MRINAEFDRRCVVDTQALPWVASPSGGIERRMLDRVGAEVARATSLVRYAPGSAFSAHEHTQGEEYLVLEGVFTDEDGDHPVGTYVRNPPGSRHTPSSGPGCVIFVKLRQFEAADLTPVSIDTTRAEWLPGLVPGLSVMPLHRFGPENVALVRWAPGTRFAAHMHVGGEEILVLSGIFQDEFGTYPAGTWIRNPPGSHHQPYSETGCTLYVKTGHLAGLVNFSSDAPEAGA